MSYRHMEPEGDARKSQQQVVFTMYSDHIESGQMSSKMAADRTYQDLRVLGWDHDEAAHMISLVTYLGWTAPND